MSQNSSDQTYDEVVTGRRSIRGFLDRPVPRALIEEVIALATRAPSSYNNQCWNFTVVTGEPLAAIREGNTAGILAGQPDSREFRRHDHTPDSHRARQVAVAKQLFGAMGIEREDKAGRQDWMMRGFRQFDAPVSIVVTYDREILGSDIAPFDCGAVTNALVNAAWSRGLGHQLAGHHAKPGGPRTRADPGGSGDHDLRCDGLAGPGLPGECRHLGAQATGRNGPLHRLR